MNHPFRRITVLVAFISTLVFFSWHLILFFSPPALTVEGDHVSSTHEPEITFRGALERESILTINDGTVYINSTDGTFVAVVPLSNGANEFVFKGRNRLGRTNVVVRRVFKD